jgi:uncharacterized membrane protein YfcA
MELLGADINQIISETDWLIWSAAAFSLLIGCWVQTALGFGMAVIAAPIIVLFKPEWGPVVLTMNALILCLLNTWNQRKYLEAQHLSASFLTRIPGSFLGAWLLIRLDTTWLQFSVAACVLLAVIISYLGKQFPYTPKRLAFASFISGITGTTTSIGGPPMALVMQHGKSQTIRANLSLYFSYSCIVSLIAYGYMGLLTSSILITCISFTPVCLLGFVGGIRARAYVDGGRFRPLLLILCGISGSIALVGALSQL